MRRLELSVLDAEVLTIALAAYVDPPLADSLQTLDERGVTLALVGDLLGLGPAARARLVRTIDACRPLVRERLIDVPSNLVLHPTPAAIDLVADADSQRFHTTV